MSITMRPRAFLNAVLLGALLGVTPAVWAQAAMPAADSSAGAPPVVTTCAQLRALTPAELRLSVPVRLRGVITFSNRISEDLFLQDETAGVFVEPDALHELPANGDLVELTGIAEEGWFAPMVRPSTIRVVGHGPSPEPVPATIPEIDAGWLDSQFAEVTGVVRGVRDRPHRIVLIVAAGTSTVQAMVPWNGHHDWTAHLLDSTIRVRGVVTSSFTRQRQRTGAYLNVVSPAAISVVRPPPVSSPFDLPARPISQLMAFDPGQRAIERVHIRAVVSARRHQTLYVADSTGAVRVDLADRGGFDPGDRIDVAGIPTNGDYGAMLTMAVARRLSAGKPLPAKDITPAEALTGDYEAALVTIKGTVVGRVTAEVGEALVLAADGQVFRARFDDVLGTAAPLPGSRVAVTGICRAVKFFDDDTVRGSGRQLPLWLRWASRRAHGACCCGGRYAARLPTCAIVSPNSVSPKRRFARAKRAIDSSSRHCRNRSGCTTWRHCVFSRSMPRPSTSTGTRVTSSSG
jgi:hypothetical protein